MDEPLFPLLSLSRLRMGTDGTGVTTLIAGAGCPLHCRWCINERLLREAPVESVSAPELIRRVAVDDLYFRATGGGVTFGGGEALLHAGFIRRFRALCPSAWHVSVETSLAVAREQLILALDAADLFIVDCKAMDGEIYRAYTGGDIALMRGNLRLLLEEAGPERVIVRVPYIPGYNTAEDQTRSAEALRAMDVTRLDLFSYVIREGGA
ncbi:MAG: radical SAM protein [Oscillospiraceae bacterium]|nr:radical SAM protein [Oscillospiraceae bacterium]